MNTEPMPPLCKDMIARADKDGLAQDHPLRVLAFKLHETPGADIKKLLGAWARARQAWCDYTGEDLI